MKYRISKYNINSIKIWVENELSPVCTPKGFVKNSTRTTVVLRCRYSCEYRLLRVRNQYLYDCRSYIPGTTIDCCTRSYRTSSYSSTIRVPTCIQSILEHTRGLESIDKTISHRLCPAASDQFSPLPVFLSQRWAPRRLGAKLQQRNQASTCWKRRWTY